MKLHLLERNIEDFIRINLQSSETTWYHPHEIVSNFNSQWHLPHAAELLNVFDASLHSRLSQRWWKKDHGDAKQIMQLLIQSEPELALIAFRDLSNDQSGLEGRLSRFDYYCTQLLEIHRQRNFKSVENSHYQDAGMISLYLSGMFPEKYALYPGLATFRKYCESVGAVDLPVIDDLVRYENIVAIINNYLQRHPGLQALTLYRKTFQMHFDLIPSQYAYEFVCFCGGNPKLEI